MFIRDIMTKSPISCVPSNTVQKAAQLMRDHDIGVIPVVESEQSQKLLGVITDRDLCMTIVADAKDASTAHVKDSMTATVVSCYPEDDLQKAETLMRDNQVRRIPIIDKENKLQGILSIADVLRRSNLPAGETLKDISQPTSEASKPRAGSSVTK